MIPCINDDLAFRFLRDELSAEENEGVAQHIDHCHSCEALLQRLSDDGSLHEMKKHLRHHQATEPQPISLPTFVLEKLRCLLPHSKIKSQEIPADKGHASGAPMSTQEATGNQPTEPEYEPGTRQDDGLQPIPFGKFDLLEECGQGGMGVVYKAWDRQLKRTVALKMIRIADGATDEEEYRQRFHREAEAMARLSHANIISILEIGEHKGRAYFTMPFLSGGSLRQHSHTALDRRQIVTLILKVARALECAHQAGVYHRDLKPGNVLFHEDGEPVVVDFGLAKLAEEEVELTQTGQVLGTPFYMAPEQTTSSSESIGAHTDVWALGVILYELLTGKRPFAAPDKQELFRRICRSDPTTPRKLASNLDRGLEAVVLKCLAKKPGERFATAGELADELERWTADQPLRTRPESLPGRSRRWIRHHPVAALLTLQCALILLFAPVAFWFFHPDRPRWELEYQLARGGPAVLIGRTGGPSWLHRRTPADVTGIGADKAYWVQTWDVALVELLKNPGSRHYRIKAEVQHVRGERLSEVGLYALHDHGQVGDVHVNSFVRVTFNDLVDRSIPPFKMLPPRKEHPGENLVYFSPRITFWKAQQESNLHDISSGLPPHWFKPKGVGVASGPWRQLTLEIDPQNVDGWFDGNFLGTLNIADLQRELDRQFQQSKKSGKLFFPAQLRPQSSLGLYVDRGMARFRNVIVEPIP